MTKMSQIEQVREIEWLSAENPECEIRFLVDNDTRVDWGSFTVQQIYRVELSRWYQDCEHVYVGEDEVYDRIAYEVNGSGDVGEQDAERAINERISSDTEMAIVVFLRA